MRKTIPFIAAILASVSLVNAQQSTPSAPNTLEENLDGAAEPAPGDPAVAAAARLREAVLRIDASATFTDNSVQFTVAGVLVMMVYDLSANRMRLMAPAAETSDISEEDLVRLMQANFESALDARYAIANGIIWSTFIHPLSPLSNGEFASGLGQVVNLTLTYGESYNSGALIFGGGDNNQAGRGLIEELEKKSNDI